MLKDGHSLCFGRVRDVLSATVLSERVSKDDVRVTARTLTTLLDVPLSNIRSGMSERGEPEATDLTFAQGLVSPLWNIGGPSASDLAQALACVLREYRACMELDQQLAYIEQMHELERRQKEDPHGEDIVF
jgi:propanediol dehydratase small subunit